MTQTLPPILLVDSYKASHYLQYPDNTEIVASYIESRGGPFEETCFVGTQAFLKKYLSSPVTADHIKAAEAFYTAHGEPFNTERWQKIVDKHGGYLPLHIRAVKEGDVIPIKNAVVTVENTDPEFAWLTSWIETNLLRGIWYPTTVATISYRIKTIILEYLDKTGDTSLINFKLHDFGARGVSSEESAALGGFAHLVNFMGTDTTPALACAQEFYNTPMAGFSIPAAEHSTMTILGKEGQKAQFERMINAFGGEGKIYAMVVDGFDLEDAVNILGIELQNLIRKKGGTLVVRPDSGDPVEVVTQTVQQLDRLFGSTVNSKGYKVLDPCVRVIQGDGIEESSIKAILEALKEKGYSADNIAFGMGGALLQKLHRDTGKWAMKCSAAKINGVYRDVYKEPKTDPGKTSKRGVLELVQTANGDIKTVRREEVQPTDTLLLQDVYKDGKLLVDENLQTIRERADAARQRSVEAIAPLARAS